MERFLKINDKIELKGIDGSYIIKDIIGRGSSCVVYLADFLNLKGEKSEHLLKEFNPKSVNLIRDDCRTLKVKDINDEAVFELLKKRFIDGYQKQKELREKEQLKNYTANIQNTYDDHGTVYIDMTVTAGKSYSDVQEKSVFDLARRIKTLTQVIGYYHELGFLHLDVKPSNIFVRPEDETCEDVLLFDCDSLIEADKANDGINLSYTLEWAPIELTIRSRGYAISKATDIFSIGEIFFEKLMGRHSKPWERRTTSKYGYDLNAPIFENTNPKVLPLLDDLFRYTLCNNPQDRYQTTSELIEILDRIIVIYNPDEPLFLKNIFSEYSQKSIKFDTDILKKNIEWTRCETEWEYTTTMNEKIKNTIVSSFRKSSKLVQKFVDDYASTFDAISKEIAQETNIENSKTQISNIVSKTKSQFCNKLENILDFNRINFIEVCVQSDQPEKIKHIDLTKKKNSFFATFFGTEEIKYQISLRNQLSLINAIRIEVLNQNEFAVQKEYIKILKDMFEIIANVFKREKEEPRNEKTLFQKALYLLNSDEEQIREQGLQYLFKDYDDRKAQEAVDEINNQLPLLNGEVLEYIDNKIFFLRKSNNFEWGGQLSFGIKTLDGMERIIFDLRTEYVSVTYKTIKAYNRIYFLVEDDDALDLYVYMPNLNEIFIIESNEISSMYGELILEAIDEKTIKYGKVSSFDSDDYISFIANV